MHLWHKGRKKGFKCEGSSFVYLLFLDSTDDTSIHSGLPLSVFTSSLHLEYLLARTFLSDLLRKEAVVISGAVLAITPFQMRQSDYLPKWDANTFRKISCYVDSPCRAGLFLLRLSWPNDWNRRCPRQRSIGKAPSSIKCQGPYIGRGHAGLI